MFLDDTNFETQKSGYGRESSPFDPSPFASNSPRLYWQNRDSASPTRFNAENRNPTDYRDGSPSPTKRSSLENLKRASRVKNSNMFARENQQAYDPTSSPNIERPLASGRPLSVQIQGNAYGGRGLDGLRKEKLLEGSKLSLYSPSKSPTKLNNRPEFFGTPSKSQLSPTKSSLSSKSKYGQVPVLEAENGTWSDDEEATLDRELPPGKSLHRHAKSVTFDAAPPQINEYEMTTPDPSSVASGSREGSYESVDNEDDSYDRGSSVERDDSFDESLEDTDKTPVVLPEDWRFMSPESANDDLAAHVENPFGGIESSPAPAAMASSAVDARVSPTRTDSANSNGERRPLPPLPALGMPPFPRARSNSASSLAATAERASGTQRILPSQPRPASISKSDIHDMAGCSMSLGDRIRLMMTQDDEEPKNLAQEQLERRLGGGSPSKSPEYEQEGGSEKGNHAEDVENDDIADLGEYKLPPRISRESILRKVKSQRQLLQENEFEYESPAPESISGQNLVSDLDPDTPLPSLEVDPESNDASAGVHIKLEDDGEDSEVDVYSIPDLYSQQREAGSYMDSQDGNQAFEEAFSHLSNEHDDDDESRYSEDLRGEGQEPSLPSPKSSTEDEGPPTPRAVYPTKNPDQPQPVVQPDDETSLPHFASMLAEKGFEFGLESFMAPKPPINEEPANEEPANATHAPPLAHAVSLLERPVTPESQMVHENLDDQWNDSISEPQTPDSVIRHPIADSPRSESPSVPEPVATIKAPGAKLKTRPSIAPADTQAMAATRRQVSGEVPHEMTIKENHGPQASVIPESQACTVEEKEGSPAEDSRETETFKQTKRKSSLVPLEISVERSDDGLGVGLDREFDRVIAAQKVAFTFLSPELGLAQKQRSPGCAEYMAGQEFKPILQNAANTPFAVQKGYLMRQNTKLVIASSASTESASESVDTHQPHPRGTRSAGSSPRKSGHAQPWITEPWNGKTRRKSLRLSGDSPQKKLVAGSAPPLPGQQSNVTNALVSLTEDETILGVEECEESGEKGILFVKVVRVKDLDLPLPKGLFASVTSCGLTELMNVLGERSYFALTLDNGLHCVTTAWLELGKTAPIGQEFELMVLNDLEFQLTLQTKLEEPKVQAIPESPVKVFKPPKQSAFSRVFGSPRKRKELELKHQEEAQRAERQRLLDAQANRRAMQPTAWDLLHGLVAKDGSFARSYVCLKDHESKAFGRPFTVDVPCFNEWATEEASMASSVKSKRSTVRGGVQRKAPYKIGKLELQLLFVPKPKGAKSDDMPKSMNACIRELKEAETATPKKWEGHLSQQGGDCPVYHQSTAAR